MEELCCKKVIINAFEQPLQQGFFQKKAVKGRLLDTLPKSGNHPGVGFCSAWLSLPSQKRIGWRPQYTSGSGFSARTRPHLAAASLTSFNTAGSITVVIDDSSLLPAHWLSAVTDWRYWQ
jgi:hypothetical protein